MHLSEVLTEKDKKDFISLPIRLYRNNPNWIRPLDTDVEGVFDRKQNKLFQQGECTRWIVRDTQGQVIGRVAAFVNNKTATKGNDQPTGGMGFFECVEDQAAAFFLFDTCKKWLQDRGMEAMDGPINFGNRDRWWGLLVEGFDRQPNYLINYNFPYYKDFFEAYGFQVYFYQLTFGRPIIAPIDEKLLRKAEIIYKNPDYKFEYLRKADWRTLPDKIRMVYNRAWARRGEIPELTEAQAKLMVKQMKPLLDERLIWFGYYKNDPIAFFLSLPEVNQIFKHVNGKLDWFGKLKFVYHKFIGTNQKALGILFGVVPEHQGKGVDGAIIQSFRIMAEQTRLSYQDYELNWIGDFNPKMIRVVEQINAQLFKKHATYRKLFDESKPFRRMPIVG
jgi:hypothetical protein